MTQLSRLALQQLQRFLGALFRPGELIELRFIESWASQGKKQSRIVRPAAWLHPDQLATQYDDLLEFADTTRANVYFGVCPRVGPGDTSDRSIRTVRCLWCDIDSTTPGEAFGRWKDSRIPMPSIVVCSGSGVHAYWLLTQDVVTSRERARLAVILPNFYRSFGGDHVQNLSRILRLPGTLNYKDARNGRPPQMCALCQCDERLRYPLKAFERWFDPAPDRQRHATRTAASASPDSSVKEILARNAETALLVFQLQKPTPDRSRRDFAVICGLLRLGLSEEEIWTLVAGTSKFQTAGRAYFDRTLANARQRLVLGDSSRGGRRAYG